MNDVLILEVCRGQAGDAIYLDGERIGGPRDNGLMTTIKSYRVSRKDILEALNWRSGKK